MGTATTKKVNLVEIVKRQVIFVARLPYRGQHEDWYGFRQDSQCLILLLDIEHSFGCFSEKGSSLERSPYL
jgi:hypothetical protein